MKTPYKMAGSKYCFAVFLNQIFIHNVLLVCSYGEDRATNFLICGSYHYDFGPSFNSRTQCCYCGGGGSSTGGAVFLNLYLNTSIPILILTTFLVFFVTLLMLLILILLIFAVRP